MQKLCCVCTIQQPLPVWIIVTSLPTHISINSHPFPVGIVSDLDQALQVYQADQVLCPQDSIMTPERSINHHFTYHIAQASQAKHGSLVDRGANGGLAGSDVRILSRSSGKYTVTGTDSHELQGLDVVQCAALVETSHGIVNLIMNEYACYGKGHTIHSSGQIEWFKNSVDDRSVQVGGKQRICTIDGYAMSLT